MFIVPGAARVRRRLGLRQLAARRLLARHLLGTSAEDIDIIELNREVQQTGDKRRQQQP